MNVVEIPRNYFACERISFVILVLSVIELICRPKPS